jgi:spermidine synthase
VTAPGAQVGLKVLVLVAGAVLMALEIAGSRLLAPHFGNSVYVWGSLISVFLAALSLGYWVGGHAADRNPSPSRLQGLCLVVAALIFVIPWWGHGACSRLVASGWGERWGPLVAATLLFLPPSFALGMVSPYAVRLAASDIASLGRAAGSLYALSTVGSIAGTLLTTFVLIPLVGVSWIFKALGVTMVVLPASLLLLRTRRPSSVVPLAAVGLLAFLPAHAAHPTEPGEKVLVDEDTPYHHLSVVDTAGGRMRMLRFDRFVESSIRLEPPYPTLSRYTNYFQLAFLARPEIRRALFIGAGGGIGPRAFVTVDPDMVVDVVDVDPRVLEIAEQHFYMPSGDRVRTHARDGRAFFAGRDERWDCIVLDAFTIGGRIPFHLCTREYFELCRGRLADGGVFVMNVNSALDGKKGAIYGAVSRTLREVFPEVLAFALGVADDPAPDRTRNVVFLARAGGGPPLDVGLLLSRVPDYPARTYVSHAMLREMLADAMPALPPPDGGALMTDDHAPIETMSF